MNIRSRAGSALRLMAALLPVIALPLLVPILVHAQAESSDGGDSGGGVGTDYFYSNGAGDNFSSNGDESNSGGTDYFNSNPDSGSDTFNSNGGGNTGGSGERPYSYPTPPPRFPCRPNALENRAWGGDPASTFLEGFLRPLIAPHCLGRPWPPSACQARTGRAAYVRGFQQGFTSCVIATALSPITLMQMIMADFGQQAAAAEALLQGNTAGAAEILRIKGEENRLRNQQGWNSLVASLNPNLIGVDPLEAGRRDGSRICQFWVVPQLLAGAGPRKGFDPSYARNEWPGVGLNPKPVAISRPTTVMLSQQAYRAALRLPFPQQYANAFAVLADDIAQRAAVVAVSNPKFLQALARGNWSVAGTYFHSAAKQVARNIPAKEVPTGFRMHVEEILTDQNGDPIVIDGTKSKPDLYFEGNCGDLVSFDWKTSARSGLRSIGEQNRYSGALGIKYPGYRLTTMQSVSWIDYVRPLLKTFPNYPYR